MPHRPARKPTSLDRRVRAGLITALGITLALLMGCASPPPAPADPLLRDHAYRPARQPLPRVDELLALSPAMHRFLATEGRALPLLQDPRRALVDLLYRSQAPGVAGLRLEYESSRTRTAAEAFEARAGNCLSLVMMTAAFARHLQMEVSYQSVQAGDFYTRSGSLTMANGHVNLLLGGRPMRNPRDRIEPGHLVVDFLSPRDIRQQHSQPLQEHTIVAMYFNNRAAELMAAGQLDEAYWHAREAMLQDPGFVHAANTLGVVHQRAGQVEAAEAAFRQVLARDDRAVAALSNLVALLRADGRAADAEPLAERLAALQPVPPFHWLRLGREALAAGDTRHAIDLLRRELRRQPEQDEVHFALAEALLRQGDVSRAQHHLAQAAEFSTRRDDQRRYEAKLVHLRAALRPTALQ